MADEIIKVIEYLRNVPELQDILKVGIVFYIIMGVILVTIFLISIKFIISTMSNISKRKKRINDDWKGRLF